MLIHCFTLYCKSFILFMGVCETCMLFSLWCERIYIFKKQNQRKSVINKVGERISPEGMFGSICNKRLWVGKYEKWNVVCAYNQHQCIYKIITFGIFAIFLGGGGIYSNKVYEFCCGVSSPDQIFFVEKENPL